MDLKLLFMVSVLSAVIGGCFGITLTAKHYRAEIINIQATALKNEQDALVKQLKTEHDWQAKQEQADKEATDEINKIKDKYNVAMSKLTNSLQSDNTSTNRTALSTNTSSSGEAKATCECGQLRQDRKTLAEYVLKLSAKCDEIAVERNELSKRYVVTHQHSGDSAIAVKEGNKRYKLLQ